MNLQGSHIITGATGLVGTFLAAALLKRGERVVLLARGPSKAAITDRIRRNLSTAAPNSTYSADKWCVFPADITFTDLTISRDDLKTLNSPASVWHCAALSQFNSDDEKVLRTNALGTLRVLEFSRKIEARRVNYVSTAYVCGNREGVVAESELEQGQTFKNTYEQSKFRAEHLVTEFGLKFDIPATIYRPSIIIGSSVTGGTTTFSGYNYLAKVFYRQKRSVISDLRKNPTTIAETGICLTTSGVRLPIRIPCSEESTINIVPIDYVVKTMLKLDQRHQSLGKVFHLTHPSPPRGRDLFLMSGDTLGIEGLSFANSLQEMELTPPRNPLLSKYERKVCREISQYVPYLHREPRFDNSNVRQALGAEYEAPPKIDRVLLKKLFDYATSVNWKRSE